MSETKAFILVGPVKATRLNITTQVSKTKQSATFSYLHIIWLEIQEFLFRPEGPGTTLFQYLGREIERPSPGIALLFASPILMIVSQGLHHTSDALAYLWAFDLKAMRWRQPSPKLKAACSTLAHGLYFLMLYLVGKHGSPYSPPFDTFEEKH